MDAWNRQPGCHGDQNRLDQRGVLPDVGQKLVKPVSIHGLDNKRGNKDSLSTGHVVTQSHVVRAAVVLLHLQQKDRFKNVWVLLSNF